jgi:hypothetical protein
MTNLLIVMFMPLSLSYLRKRCIQMCTTSSIPPVSTPSFTVYPRRSTVLQRLPSASIDLTFQFPGDRAPYAAVGHQPRVSQQLVVSLLVEDQLMLRPQSRVCLPVSGEVWRREERPMAQSRRAWGQLESSKFFSFAAARFRVLCDMEQYYMTFADE